MENNLFSELLKCQIGDDRAISEVIKKFEPLLRSQSKRLNSEDSFEDLQLFLLEFIKSDKINQLRNQNDFVVLSYLKKTVTNYATNLVKKKLEKLARYHYPNLNLKTEIIKFQ